LPWIGLIALFGCAALDEQDGTKSIARLRPSR